MAGTFALAGSPQQARAAGAKLLLVGDPCQLSAVETGGAFGLLAAAAPDTAHPDRGAPVHRPGRHPPHLGGTRRRRAAHRRPDRRPRIPRQHGRVHGGDRDAMTDAAYTGVARPTPAPAASSVLIAADNDTVRAAERTRPRRPRRRRRRRRHQHRGPPRRPDRRPRRPDRHPRDRPVPDRRHHPRTRRRRGGGRTGSSATVSNGWWTGPAGTASLAVRLLDDHRPARRARSPCPPDTSASTSNSATPPPRTAPRA